MKISHAWLQEYFKDTLPSVEALAELFTFHSFEIEGVEKVGNDSVIDAKILPDRAHFCLSYRGIAEEVKVLTGLNLVPLEDTVDGHLPLIDLSLSPVEVKVEDDTFCRRYVSRRVSNVEIIESPEKMKTMLSAMDGRSINSLVDATNIAMFDYGQPLHIFDADKVAGNLVVRKAEEGESITLLDGKDITLSSNDYVIADNEGPLAIAGVKGGKRAEVTMSAKNIIIESAHFHPAFVRKTSTKYNLRNESSKRFENEVTPEYAMDGMNHISALVHKLSPKAVFGPITDFYSRPAVKTVISISLDFINQKLGIEIPKEEVVRILSALSIGIEEKGNELLLTIPYHRLDLVIKEDIVEEVGRIYGYEKIQGTSQISSADTTPANPHFYVTEQIKNILVGQGFSETYLYAFTSKGDIEVAYPLASDKKALRTNLSDGIAKALEMNVRNADFLFLDSIKIFEIGKVFTKKGEHTSLGVGIKRIKKVKGETANEDIRQLRGLLLKALGVDVVTACTIDDTGGLMLLNGKQIGTINNIDGIMEINLDALIPSVKIPSYESLYFGSAPKVSYQPFSPYPFMVRDIAVFVPESVDTKEVEDTILSNGTTLLLLHHLFDTFQKEGKISYAFRLIFQSYDKTLTEDEITQIMAKISSKMVEKGWQVR